MIQVLKFYFSDAWEAILHLQSQVLAISKANSERALLFFHSEWGVLHSSRDDPLTQNKNPEVEWLYITLTNAMGTPRNCQPVLQVRMTHAGLSWDLSSPHRSQAMHALWDTDTWWGIMMCCTSIVFSSALQYAYFLTQHQTPQPLEKAELNFSGVELLIHPMKVYQSQKTPYVQGIWRLFFQGAYHASWQLSLPL